jgi:hypothetical protein
MAQKPAGVPARVAQNVAVPAPASARKTAGDPDVPISTVPVSTVAVVRRPNPSTLASAGPGSPDLSPNPTLARRVRARSAEAVAAVPDSIFDHTADVEFVLDPVKLRRERGRGYTPVPTSVRGEQASITF